MSAAELAFEFLKATPANAAFKNRNGKAVTEISTEVPTNQWFERWFESYVSNAKRDVPNLM